MERLKESEAQATLRKENNNSRKHFYLGKLEKDRAKCNGMKLRLMAPIKLYATVALIILASSIFVASLEATHQWSILTVQDPTIVKMIAQVNETNIYDTIFALQNFVTRVYGETGNTQARTYLHDRLVAISPRLSVSYQGTYNNVIATLTGTNPNPDVYMVGAHYDSYSSDPSNAPGATDDAGGCAIVLELARIMSQYRFNQTLKLAFWNYEENGCKGSEDYVNHGLPANMQLYVNYDSALLGGPNPAKYLDIMYDDQSIADTLTQYNILYNIGLQLNYNGHYGQGVTCSSDYEFFKSAGVGWVMTHSQVTAGTPTPDNSADHAYQHTPDDTLDKVSTVFGRKNGELGMSLLATLAGVQSPNAHDITLRNIVLSKYVMERGFTPGISVTVQNTGAYTETFNVTTYVNAVVLNKTLMTLMNGSSQLASSSWNTTVLAYGNYTISAYAEPVLNETNTDDNSYSTWAVVTILGDINGDFKVSLADLVVLADAYGSRLGDQKWNPNADIDSSAVVGLSDLVILALHYGQHYP